MESRYHYLLLLIFLSLLAPVWAEDAATTVEPDPALEAIQALGGAAPAEEPATISPETAAPAGAEPAMPGDATATPEELATTPETQPVPEPELTAEPDLPEELELANTPEPDPATPRAKDVIVVLDNSGSMKKNDPLFIAKQAVTEFIGVLDEATRVGVIIFDQNVRVAVPFTEMNDATREAILQSLDQINYKGLFTDSPAAIERAIYELKTNGRADAEKLIVFMTDGIVDTGNKDNDLEKAKWLKDELAADAAESGIKIFGIAYTENADFHLIQSIAQTTGGEYYRALLAEELKNVFEQVHTLINKVPEPEPEVVAPVPPLPPPVVTPPQVIIKEVQVESKTMGEEEDLRSKMILVALSVLIVAVIIMVLMLLRGSRKKGAEDEYAQEAYLNDIHTYTAQASYKLDKTPAMLGRVAGTDTEHLNYIVIPQTTIGRRHALIEYKDFAYWIIDQGSINGTFVNDQLISSETRLKHGDRVRLHKYEFEFVMPEMVEAGMTVISKTTLAANPMAAGQEESTIARGSGHASARMEIPEPDFDITGSAGPAEINPDEEDTVIRGSTPAAAKEEPPGDETIMLDDDSTSIDDDEDATIRPDADDK